MGPSRKRLLGVAVSVAVLIITGCGSEGISEAQFRTRANRVCKRYADSVKKVPDARTIADIPRTLDATAPLLARLVSDLKAIDAPDSVADEYADLIKRTERSQKTVVDLRTAALARDKARLRAVALDAQRRDKQYDRVATNLGLGTCTEG
ncbi:MAG: hypothetical protein M3296_05635 [Actinomycetota bacterium]|nr:hypothetical protein [Actinomycetota bacterium]